MNQKSEHPNELSTTVAFFVSNPSFVYILTYANHLLNLFPLSQVRFDVHLFLSESEVR
jgi:hypothetical protein